MFTIKHIVTICLKHASAQLTKTLQNCYLLKNGSIISQAPTAFYFLWRFTVIRVKIAVMYSLKKSP